MEFGVFIIFIWEDTDMPWSGIAQVGSVFLWVLDTLEQILFWGQLIVFLKLCKRKVSLDQIHSICIAFGVALSVLFYEKIGKIVNILDT